ncbi:MAG: hypothetical protein P8M30_05150 [Planctomycetaceae bacterium]|jgi:hypothetical protein|nr:hypothetical protein [Planctomycetaceae bacterium]
MSEFESVNDQQHNFERALQQLQPAAPELNLSNLMYRTGHDAAIRQSRRQLRRWQLSTVAASVCAFLALNVSNNTAEKTAADFVQQEPAVPAEPLQVAQVQETPENSRTESDSETIAQSDDRSDGFAVDESPFITPLTRWVFSETASLDRPFSYLELRNRLLREGIDSLPEPRFERYTNSSRNLEKRPPLRLRDAWDEDLWNQI